MGRRRRRGKDAEELTLEGFAAADMGPEGPSREGEPVDPETGGAHPPEGPAAAEAPGAAGEEEPSGDRAEAPARTSPEAPETVLEAAEPHGPGEEDAAREASLSAPRVQAAEGGDLPPEPGVLQRSVPPIGGIVEGSDGPELAAPGDSSGEPPRAAPAESSPTPDPAGPTSETPVQDRKSVV